MKTALNAGKRSREESVKEMTMHRETSGTGRGQDAAGFALILALLALMLLTFLGLTLATTTSTELQVAANYRWSQQAYYNAEAGLEAAKIMLRRVQDANRVLPVARVGTSWNEYTANPAAAPTGLALASASRNFENWRCDKRGNGMGYGVVINDGFAGAPYQDVTSIFGNPLQGAFTVWARRQLLAQGIGVLTDNPGAQNVIITSEGVAPNPNSPNRAVKVLEMTLLVVPPCDPTDPQASATGGSPCGAH